MQTPQQDRRMRWVAGALLLIVFNWPGEWAADCLSVWWNKAPAVAKKEANWTYAGFAANSREANWTWSDFS
jgi:hypothetical protein